MVESEKVGEFIWDGIANGHPLVSVAGDRWPFFCLGKKPRHLYNRESKGLWTCGMGATHFRLKSGLCHGSEAW